MIRLSTVPARVRLILLTGGLALSLSACSDGGNGTPQCDDGIDNDQDGLIDGADTACLSGMGLESQDPAQCEDGIDNDGDGQIDCADRYCQGIAYLCKTPPPTACVYGREGDNVLDCTDPAYQRGELCCTKQSVSEASPNLQHIVNGLECTPGSANDGYYDCSCDNSGAFNASGTDDCFAPGATAGDLCCDAGGNVATK